MKSSRPAGTLHLSFIFCVVTIILMGFGLVGSVAVAADGTLQNELGIHFGELLPSRIANMTEIMSTWGLRFGLDTQFGVVEFDGQTAHGFGSDYYNVSAGLRESMPIFPGANGIFFGGLDGTAYQTSTSSKRKQTIGYHFGGGLMLRIVDSVWLRTDARITNQPGTILYVGLGLVYRGF